MKRILLLVVVLFSLGLLGDVLAAGAEKPVVVLVRTGAEADGIRAAVEEYKRVTGRPVELTELGRSGYYPTLHTQLIAGTEEFDLAQANGVDVSGLAKAGAISPIDVYLNDPQYTDPKEFDLEDLAFVYKSKGRAYALPFDVSTHFLYYRNDLVSSPPQTWDQYYETALKWTKATNPDSPTLFGASLTALAGSEQPKVFYSVMWSMGGWIIDEEGNVGVDRPGAIRAGKFYRKLIDAKLLPPDVFSWGFSNVLDALKTGAVAMGGPYWNAAYQMIRRSDSPYKNNVAITLVPGVLQKDGTIYRAPFQQGKVILLNANSRRKEAAWDFYKFLCGKEGMRIYAAAGGTPSRFSAYQDPTFEFPEYYRLMQDSLRIAKGDPGLPFYLQQHEAMNEALSSIITGQSEVEPALRQAGDKIRNLWKELQEGG
ncbi:MAG: extracellular solute-binding protein [bacterium]